MSNHLISEVYKRQVGNMARKAVMVLFADKASDDGSGIWASKQRMADEIGASKQTVIATIKTLIDDGLLSECGQRKNSNGYTVEYTINVRTLRALPLVKSHQEDQSENLTGQAASPVKEFDLTSQAALPDQSENLTQTPLNPPKPPKGKVVASADAPLTVSELVEDWNDLAAETGLSKVKVMSDARRKRAAARIKKFPDLTLWQQAFANIRGSPFLLGDNDKGWKADFDFLLQDKSFSRLIEGTYG